MPEITEKKSPYFTMKKKIIAAIICGAAVILWLILWLIFPMPFYSMFFASNIGSNVLLAMLCLILTFPILLLFTKVLKRDIPVPVTITVNLICTFAFIYMYSICRYDNILLVILPVALHCIGTAVIYSASRSLDAGIKRIKKEKDSKIKPVLFGIISVLMLDGFYLLLFTALLETFRE